MMFRRGHEVVLLQCTVFYSAYQEDAIPKSDHSTHLRLGVLYFQCDRCLLVRQFCESIDSWIRRLARDCMANNGAWINIFARSIREYP